MKDETVIALLMYLCECQDCKNNHPCKKVRLVDVAIDTHFDHPVKIPPKTIVPPTPDEACPVCSGCGLEDKGQSMQRICLDCFGTGFRR